MKTRLVKKLLAGGALVIIAGILAFAFAFIYVSRNLPTVEQILNVRISQSTNIYDKTGKVLLYKISGGEERTIVPVEKIPKHLKDATVSIEDERFYEEPAFDWKGIVRALFVNIRHGEARQGASTITQQLARNAFLTTEQTISRKIKEIILAVKINRHYSKDQILGLYLNQIPYGATAYGIEAASETFFEKSAEELNLAESAVIAALPKAPSYYSPWGNHAKELLARQRVVLNKMLELKKISRKEYDDALKFQIAFSPRRNGIRAPHFAMAVQEYLVQKYGEELVRKGGLRVITTLDWELQQAAEKAVREVAEKNEKSYGVKNAALVAEDAKTGQILALVGSRDYFDTEHEGNFDVASLGLRQPGSSLKPFIYLTAFERGYTPDTVLFDVPTEFAAGNPACPPAPNFNNDRRDCFHPQNYGGLFRGPITMRQALAQSVNIPAVKTLYLVGVRDAVKKAYDFGLTTLSNPDNYGLALALGGGAVKLIDLVGAYSILAQDGIKQKQSILLEVVDARGRVLESYKDESVRVADSQPVRLVNNILSDVEARRPLFHNITDTTVFPGHDVALKTGTSNDFRDVWAVGYTPSFVVGVWEGNNDNSPMKAAGSSILTSVPLWRAFMTEAVKKLPFETFIKPEPLFPQKPILRGDYLHNKQIHSILYFVDRKNPDGPPPERPDLDPQFNNWEPMVIQWAQNNIPNFFEYNQTVAITPGEPVGNAPPTIEVQRPSPGESVNAGLEVRASIRAVAPIARVKVYWNSALLDEQIISNSETSIVFEKGYALPPDTRPQNLLEIEAVDQNNSSRRTGIIVYVEN